MVANRRHAFRFNGESWVSYTSTLVIETVIGSIIDRDLLAFDDGNNVQIIEYSAYENDFITRLENVATAAQGFSTGGGGYVTVDNDLYYRQPDGNLQSIDRLPHNLEKVVNVGPYYIGYQLVTGDAYIQMVSNGEIVGTATQPGGKLVPEPLEEAGSGRLLVNPYAFVSYTGNNFESAETLYLHRVLNFSYSGPIEHFALSSVTIDDAMGNRAVTSFDYPGEAATDPAGLSSQYSQVIRIRGSADKNTTPYGTEVIDYHNGLLPPEPGNEMPTFLNGMVKKQEYRNANGEPVRTDSYQYAVYTTAQDTDGNNINTIGQYVRTVEETEEHRGDGDNKLTVRRNYAYHEANGIEKERQVQNETLDGSEERVERYTFAFEIPAYKEDLVRDYCLEPVAQTERLTNGNAVSRRATIWKKWSFQDDREVLAPHAVYEALSANASMGDSDWDGTTTPPEDMWLQRSQIEARNEAGEILEALDNKGLRHSIHYDRHGYFQVAQYPNASRLAGQATSISFEDYEDADGWQLDGDEAGLWSSRILHDCHAGSYSLRLTNQTLRRANSFRDPEARKYLLTCWIKTEAQLRYWGAKPAGARL
ncbi:MAG: hypothetical protein EBE86_024030 [Hormoscilla sp. GUM202]|nr:hypothetical protein [Hormoscilla sp. GUM202]